MKNFNEQYYRILVSGKSGFIGSSLEKSWFGKKHVLIPLVRKHYTDSTKCACSNRYYCACNLPDNIDICIHLGGASVSRPFYSNEYKQTLYNSHVIATRELLYTILPKLKNLKLVLIASAASVYGDRGTERLTESSQLPERDSQNFLNKLLADKESSLDRYDTTTFTVMRFGIVRGNSTLEKRLKIMDLIRIGSGQQHIATVSLENLMLAIGSLVQEPVENTVVNLVDDSSTYKERFNGSLPVPIPRYILERSILQNLIISTNVKSTLLHKRFPASF